MKLIILPAVAIFIAVGCNALPRFPNARFVGMGYNLIKGNPDNNYHDPGFLFSILEFTWNKGSTSSDGKYEVPDHVQALQTRSCGFHSETTIVRGARSYQESLSKEVKTEATVGISFFASASYTGSDEYKRVKKGTSTQHRVYTIARAKCVEYELAINYRQSDIRATDDFENDVNALPLSNDEESNTAYNTFIETYGSHFTSRVVLGAKMVTRSEFEEDAWTTMEKSNKNVKESAELSTWFASAGRSTETDKEREKRQSFESSRSSNTKYYRGSHPPSDGRWETWSQFAGNSPAPVSYTLTPITYLISEKYFPGMDTNKLITRLTLLTSAFKRYCSTVPGCEVPPQDRARARMINATANFLRSPSRLSCPPNYKLVSCGIKNTITRSPKSTKMLCDRKRYAIPDENNGCKCKDKRGSKCVSWCTALELTFSIVKSSEFYGLTTVYCSEGYKVL